MLHIFKVFCFDKLTPLSSKLVPIKPKPYMIKTWNFTNASPGYRSESRKSFKSLSLYGFISILPKIEKKKKKKSKNQVLG